MNALVLREETWDEFRSLCKISSQQRVGPQNGYFIFMYNDLNNFNAAHSVLIDNTHLIEIFSFFS